MALVEKKIEFTAHTATISYDDEKSWTEDDFTLESTFITLIEANVNLSEMMYKSLSEYSPIAKEIDAVRAFLMLITDLIKEAIEEADNFINSMMTDEDYSRDILTEKFNVIVNALSEYHPKLLTLEPTINSIVNFIHKYIELDEDYSLWDELSAIESKHFKNWETNSIDIVAYDRAKEYFQAYVSVHSNSNTGIYRLLDGYILDYNKLMLQTEMQYAIWNEFSKRVDLLNKMVKIAVDPMNTGDVNLN